VEGLGGGGTSGFGMGVGVFHLALVQFGNRWVGPDQLGRKLCLFVAFAVCFGYTHSKTTFAVSFSQNTWQIKAYF
jgi:hypothetical protein